MRNKIKNKNRKKKYIKVIKDLEDKIKDIRWEVAKLLYQKDLYSCIFRIFDCEYNEEKCIDILWLLDDGRFEEKNQIFLQEVEKDGINYF